jgi:hypothetical protein
MSTPPLFCSTIVVPLLFTLNSAQLNGGLAVHFDGKNLSGDRTPKYASAPIAASTTRIAQPYVIKNSIAACPFLMRFHLTYNGELICSIPVSRIYKYYDVQWKGICLPSGVVRSTDWQKPKALSFCFRRNLRFLSSVLKEMYLFFAEKAKIKRSFFIFTLVEPFAFSDKFFAES